MGKLYRFPCGCAWPLLEDDPPEGVLPLLDFDVERAPADCPAAWALLGRGECKGVFQLESPLGRQWTKRLKPESAEHLGALGAILRPGCLQAVDEDGVSTTLHYCRRKNGEEPVPPYHPAVDPILAPTYNLLVYQEQAMALAQAVAGFSLQEADVLRKAIGKKLPEEMAKCERMFLEGAARAGVVPADKAEELFGWIKESQRYSFNKSHALCYGLTGYDCAYLKAHFPVAFFTSWLANARHKQDPQQERFELVQDARLFDVPVEPPDLRSPEPYVHTDRRAVKFGLCDVKGVGEAQAAKLREAVAAARAELGRPVGEWSWFDFLVHCAGGVPASVVVRLVEAGALRWTGLGRRRMLAEFAAWDALTEKEQAWVRAAKAGGTATGLLPALALLGAPRYKKPKRKADPAPAGPFGGCGSDRRESVVRGHLSLLTSPPTPLVDTPDWLAFAEEQLLGVSLTCSKIDACDVSDVNCTCKEYRAGRGGYLVLGVEVLESREVRTRKGKAPGSRMGRLVVSDGTCSLEAVVFPDAWKEFGHALTEGSTAILRGERDQNREYDSFIVKRAWRASRWAAAAGPG